VGEIMNKTDNKRLKSCFWFFFKGFLQDFVKFMSLWLPRLFIAKAWEYKASFFVF